MPTLFRFVVICGFLAGLGYLSLYILATHFEPEPKEISKAVRNVTPK
ncbi:MAG: histidine kinase [Pseudomonadota bacterium]|nr:histidine kinase [Pseudomonadota bacterium]